MAERARAGLPMLYHTPLILSLSYISHISIFVVPSCSFNISFFPNSAAASGAIQLQGRVLRVDAADVDKSVAHPPHGRSGGGSADSYFMPQALAAGAPYSYPPPGHPVPGQFVALQQQQPAQYVYAADPHSGVQPGATVRTKSHMELLNCFALLLY